MTKINTILFIVLILGIFLPATTHVLAADFSTKTCASLVCNPAPNLFSTSFCAPGVGCTFKDIFTKIIDILLGLSGLVAMLFIIIGGYQYMTSGANQKLSEQGKKTLTNAIIGLVIIVLSYVIIRIVVTTLGGR